MIKQFSGDTECQNHRKTLKPTCVDDSSYDTFVSSAATLFDKLKS